MSRRDMFVVVVAVTVRWCGVSAAAEQHQAEDRDDGNE